MSPLGAGMVTVNIQFTSYFFKSHPLIVEPAIRLPTHPHAGYSQVGDLCVGEGTFRYTGDYLVMGRPGVRCTGRIHHR